MIILCARFPKMRVQWLSVQQEAKHRGARTGNGAVQAYSICSPLVLWKETKVSTSHFINFDLQCWAQCGKDPRRSHWEALFQEPSGQCRVCVMLAGELLLPVGPWPLTSMLEAELKMRKRYLVSILQCLPPIFLLRLIHLTGLPESQKRQRCFYGKLRESWYKWIWFTGFSCLHLRGNKLWAPVGLRSQLCCVDEELAEIWGHLCGLS